MPRFRAEIGPFIGFVGAMDLRAVDGGYDPAVTDNGVIGGAELSLRGGFGLDGVIGESGDGLVFASLGVRGDTVRPTTQRSRHLRAGGRGLLGDLLALRHREPVAHAVLPDPGDLLFASPMYFISPETYTGMAVTASNGGLIPWQTGWATRFDAFSSCSVANWVPRSMATAASTTR